MRPLLPLCLALVSCGGRAALPRAAELPEYPPAVPVTVPRTPSTPPVLRDDTASLTNTRWSGTDSDGDLYSFHFKPNGALHYESPSGSYDTATWQQRGSHVTWEMNNHYAEYEATIVSSTTMDASAHNREGHTWTLTLEKQK